MYNNRIDMAICNIFKQLTKETGTFLTFSQYAEDITKQHSVSGYKVVPSKFYACNINYAKYDNAKYDNYTLPILLQNKFENGCAYLKNTYPKWTPETSKTLFWNAISDLIIGNEILDNDEQPTGEYNSSIVYVGDINIQSYSNKDNIGYNEIYCYIPNDGKKCNIYFKENEIDKLNYVTYKDNYICGYNENDSSISGLIGIDEVYGTSYCVKDIYSISGQELLDENEFNKFEFNTIIVCYNIESEDQEIYTNIPLGIYFTGTIDDGVMTNPVTKFISNNDIYGSGTSYGLRICSRFTVAPNSTSIKSDVSLLEGNDAEYAAFSQAMSQMAESQIKMDEVIKNINNYNIGMKNHIMSLTNSNINVPYVLDVNGVPYWFVNGKNTGYDALGPQGPQGEKGIQGDQGLQGEKGSMLILDNSLTSTVLEDISQTASIVEALNFRPGDYTISYDTNTIYILNSSGDMFTKHNCLTPTQALIDEVTKKVTENLLMNWVDVYE